MSKIPSYGKVWNLGNPNVSFIEPGIHLDIEEKVDGSQFSAMKLNGRLHLRSKNCEVYPESPPDMFAPATAYLFASVSKMRDGLVYRFETLKDKKHNHLLYDRIPLNHLVLFDVHTVEGKFLEYAEKKEIAKELGVDCVPLLYRGAYRDLNQILGLLKEKSYLGGPLIEGVVLKPWEAHWEPGTGKRLIGKYVSEVFREEQKISWKSSNPNQTGKIEAIASSFATEARYRKIVQHREEDGLLKREYSDIGPLMQDLVKDIEEECKEVIKERLWAAFRKDVVRSSSKGFVKWYKEWLALEMQERNKSDDNT